MGKFNYIQNSFSYGEVDPKAFGRSDTKNYQQGLKKLDNFVALPTGGITRRNGIRKRTSLIAGALTDATICEHVITEDLRFFIVVSSTLGLGYSNTLTILDSNFVVVSTVYIPSMTSTPEAMIEPYEIGDYCQYGVNLIITEKYGRYAPILLAYNQSLNSYTLNYPYYKANITDTKFYALGLPFELTYNLTTTRLICNLTGAETTETLSFDSGSGGYPVPNIFLKEDWKMWRVIQAGVESVVQFRMSDNAGLITNQFTDVLSTAVSTAADTITHPSAVQFPTGSIVQVSGEGSPNGLPKNTDLYVRNAGGNALSFYETAAQANAGGATGLRNITTAGFGTFQMELIAVPTATAFVVLDGHGASVTSANWTHSLFYDTAWPRVCCVYQNRLVFGNTSINQDALFVSDRKNIVRFTQERLVQDRTITSPPENANISGLGFYGAVQTRDPFVFSLASKSFEGIRWLSVTNSLIVGTSSSEYGVITTEFSDEDKGFLKYSGIGSAQVRPSSMEGKILHIDRTGKGFRYLQLNADTSNYESKDISILNKKMIDYKSGYEADVVVKKLIANSTSGITWAILSDGGLVSIVMSETGAVIAGSRHTLSDGILVIDGCSYTGDDGIERLVLVYRTDLDDDLYIGEIPMTIFEGTSLDLSLYSDDRAPVYLDHCSIVKNRLKVMIFNNGNRFRFDNADINSSVATFTHTFQFRLLNCVSAVIFDHIIVNKRTVELSTTAGKLLSIKVFKTNEALVKSYTIAGALVENTEYIVSVTFDNGAIKVFVNGIDKALTLVTNDAFTEIDYSATAFFRLFGAVYASTGYIGRYTFHNKALIQSEIDSLYLSISEDLPLTDREYFTEGLIKAYVEVYTASLIKILNGQTKTYTYDATLQMLYKASGIIADPSLKIDWIPYPITPIAPTYLGNSFNISGFDAVSYSVIDGGVAGYDLVLPVSTIEVTNNNSTETVAIGYGNKPIVETLPLEAGAQFGTAIGMIQRVNEAIFQFYRTFLSSIKIGANGEAADRLTGSAVEDKKEIVGIAQNSEIDNNIILEVDNATPCTLLAITYKGVTNDD